MLTLDSLFEESQTITGDPRFRQISSLIVKVTNRCNLDCKYCYEKVSKTGDDMSLDTFRELVDKVFNNTVKDRVLFIFHGGEPTLLPNEWFQAAVDYANNAAAIHGKKVIYGIQTNVISINPDKCKLYDSLGIRISASIDGPLHILKDSLRGQERIAIRNLHRMREAGIMPGMLTTINQLNYPYFRELMDWLHDEFQIKTFKANIVYSVGAGYYLPALEPAHVIRAQKDIVDYMVETDGVKVTESNLVSEIHRFLNQHKTENTLSLCDERICGAGKRVFGVTLDGQLLPCGRFEWKDKDYFLGDLAANPDNFSMEKFRETVDRFHELAPANWAECDSCEARKMCRFGCQAFIVRSKTQINNECMPTKIKHAYFKSIEKELRRIHPAIMGPTAPPKKPGNKIMMDPSKPELNLP